MNTIRNVHDFPSAFRKFRLIKLFEFWKFRRNTDQKLKALGDRQAEASESRARVEDANGK